MNGNHEGIYAAQKADGVRKVLSIIGTRPEAVKMAPVIRALRQHPGQLESLVCITGQHRQMLDQVLSVFDIQPDHDLDLMRPNQSLAQLTGDLFYALDSVLDAVKPDWVLAQGDTTTVFVAGVSAFYRKIRFGHVEAGLRSQDKLRPFPEEINRRLADVVADAYFAPTEGARNALLREGVPDTAIYVTGNTVIDALFEVAARDYRWANSPLARLPEGKRYVLVTAHRRESFGEPFRQLCMALKTLALRFESEGVHFVYPVHLNPNVQQPVYEILGGVPNISLIEPLEYPAFVHLMKRSTLILSDSGGVQEEALGLGTPLLLLRDVTERPEGIAAGGVRLVGTQASRIVEETVRLLTNPEEYARMCNRPNPYGDGKSAERIAKVLLGF